MKTATKTATMDKVIAKQEKMSAKKGSEAIKKTEKFTFLVDGITGKNLQNAKIDTNNEVKKENTSLSFCLKQVVKHDKGFISSFKNFKETDCSPKNLLPLLKGKEAKNGRFSAWLVMTLIRRYYAQK